MNKAGGYNMKLTQEEKRVEFINSIRIENKISFKSIYICIKEKENEINSMDKIFDLDDEQSIKQRLVLLKLISRSHAEENMDYYMKAKRILFNFTKKDIENYKSIMITALMQNTKFYISACNWCGLIQNEAKRKNMKIRPIKTSFTYPYETQPVKLVMNGAARPADSNEEDLISNFFPIKCKYHNMGGELEIKTNNQNQIQLIFFFDKEYKFLPYNLEVCFKRNKGKEKKYKLLKIVKTQNGFIDYIKSDLINNLNYSELNSIYFIIN